MHDALTMAIQNGPDSTSESRAREDAKGEASNDLGGYLPLVSVIVTNYNYALYIRQAIDSVFLQTYKNIECIVVDDCSTDISIDVIRSAMQAYPQIKLVENSENSGQSASCINGFRVARGAYVIFLDADDYLLEECVEMHVTTHLSLHLPLGFTSVDVLQLVDGQIVTAGLQGFNEYMSKQDAPACKHLKTWVPEKLGLAQSHDLPGFVHYVRPQDSGFFPWSPTSGNCFRKDALKLVLGNVRLLQLRTCTDTYLLRTVSALCGSALINRPQAVYRLHSNNNFMNHPSLFQIRPFMAKHYEPLSYRAMSIAIDHILDSWHDLTQILYSPSIAVGALQSLSQTWPPLTSPNSGLNYLSERLLLERRYWINILGARTYLRVLFPKVRIPLTFLLLPILPLVSKFVRWRMKRRASFQAR